MQRLIRCAVILMICGTVWIGGVHACFACDLTRTESHFYADEVLSGSIEVPGSGSMRYYAQNEPIWENLVYEGKDSVKRRVFGDSGCLPSSLAMAVARLVPENELQRITSRLREPPSLCVCSLSRNKCLKEHARYLLTTDTDYLRFLPLVIGDFACGNNLSWTVARTENGGTDKELVKGIAGAYGLEWYSVSEYETAMEKLDAGCAVVAMSGKGSVFTSNGHYVLLAGRDAEYCYILDPLARETYKNDKGHLLKILQPGLVALRHTDRNAARFYDFIVFERVSP